MGKIIHKRHIMLVAVLVLILSCSNGDDIKPFHFVMGTDYYPASTMNRPQKGTNVQDPDFLTTLQRVTDKSDGYYGPGIENQYATVDPENSDGSLIILRANNGGWFLYNPSTCQMIKEVITDWSQEPDPIWDQSDPKVFYYVWNTELRSYNVDTDAFAITHDFKQEFPGATFVDTHSYGTPSLGRRYWCLMVKDADWNVISVIVYDRTLDAIVGQKSSGFPDVVRGAGMDMSGNHCVINFENITYAQAYTRDFSTLTNLPDGSNGHNDLALTADGTDVLVYQNVRTDYIALADLNTGIETPLLHIPFEINPDIGLHFSGNASKTPGWVLVSTYGAKNPPPGEQPSWMDCQLFMLELKTNPRVWRIAHTQSYTSRFYTGEKNFFAEAFATINDKGTKIYWGSNWRKYTQDYTDTYQITLPDDWTTAMPK
jgi:hypothetical protein